MENSSQLLIVRISTIESNWNFDSYYKIGLITLQNQQQRVLINAMSKKKYRHLILLWNPSYQTKGKHFLHLSSLSCFCCMHITEGLEVALQNMSWKLPRKANLSHILPCSVSLRCVSVAERMKWLHIVPQCYYVLSISITKVPLDFSPINAARGLLSSFNKTLLKSFI